jgi:hypothetical protein
MQHRAGLLKRPPGKRMSERSRRFAFEMRADTLTSRRLA